MLQTESVEIGQCRQVVAACLPARTPEEYSTLLVRETARITEAFFCIWLSDVDRAAIVAASPGGGGRIADIRAAARLAAEGRPAIEGCAAAAPLLLAGSVAGVLALWRARPFEAGELLFLSRLAKVAAIQSEHLRNLSDLGVDTPERSELPDLVHELRQPLSAMEVYCYCLEQGLESHSKLRSHAAGLRRQVQHVEDILARASGHTEETSAAETESRFFTNAAMASVQY